MKKYKEAIHTVGLFMVGLLVLLILVDVGGYTFKLLVGKKSVIRIDHGTHGFYLETRAWWFGDRWEILYLHRPDPSDTESFAWMRRVIKKNGEVIKHDSNEAGWYYVYNEERGLPETTGPFFFRLR